MQEEGSELCSSEMAVGTVLAADRDLFSGIFVEELLECGAPLHKTLDGGASRLAALATWETMGKRNFRSHYFAETERLTRHPLKNF